MQKTMSAPPDMGLCVLNTAGEIVEINEAAQHMLQLSPDMALGLQFGDAFRCENSLEYGCGHGEKCRHCPVRKNIEAAIMEDEFAGEFNILMRSHTGGLRVLWMRLRVEQLDADGERQIVVTMVDESERRAAEYRREQGIKENV